MVAVDRFIATNAGTRVVSNSRLIVVAIVVIVVFYIYINCNVMCCFVSDVGRLLHS